MNSNSLTVGIVGLGLIGGSMARAYHAAGHRVLATDKKKDTMKAALESGVVSAPLTEEGVGTLDLLLLAVYPKAAIATLASLADKLGKDTLVIDLCGTKRDVCRACFPIAEAHGFDFVGGHPMAGTQFSGFENSREGLFVGAPMVIVLPREDEALMARVCHLLAPVRFGSFAVTTAEQHDRVIAFTSQLAHVVSNAYVKSPQAQIHHGFSAGSYRDLTRVAWLNESMWTELFLENSDYLAEEIDLIVASLKEYSDALRAGDGARLTTLLREGRIAKEMADKDNE